MSGPVAAIRGRAVKNLDSIQRYLESPTLSSLIRKYPQFVQEFQEEVVEVRELSLGKA